jgi:hypothetical protein
MHFEILVEDASGEKFLNIIVPKIIGTEHSFNIISYKGLGDLLKSLPSLLRSYGRAWQGYDATVFVICDLDKKCLKQFRQQLFETLNTCQPPPSTRFCIAIEEGEAWLLGDIPAIEKAYPHAKSAVLKTYKNDSICGTWEKLADALYKGGAASLKLQNPGAEKCVWAEKITPHMNIDTNQSPSFQYFRDNLRRIATT